MKTKTKPLKTKEDCEYDCDECECLATGCELYGKCELTFDEKRVSEVMKNDTNV